MNRSEAIVKYEELMEGARNRSLEDVKIGAFHHIKPKSIHPELRDDPGNIVRLTNFEHIMAHLYLCYMYNGANRFKMASALQLLLDTKFESLSDIDKLTIQTLLEASRRLDKLTVAHSMPVVQFDKDFNYITTYDSIKEASDAIGLKVSTHISRCCRGELPRTVKGYVFRYKHDVDNGILNEEALYDKRNLKKVRQYDANGVFIAEFPSIGTAEKMTKVDHTSIAKCCNSKSPKAGGFIWKYASDENPDFSFNFMEIKREVARNRVNQYKADGSYIKTFESIREAADECGVSIEAIYAAIHKDRMSCGFRWRYEDSDIDHNGIEPYDFKVILQIDKKGNILAEYNTFADAERVTGIDSRVISGCCTMKYHTAGGFIWKFKDNYDGDISWNLENPSKAVIQYDLDGNVVAEYDSCIGAARALGLKKASAISLACRDWNRLSAKSHWRYKDEVEDDI